MKTGKKSLLYYLGIFIASFVVGLLAGKLAIPVSPTSAIGDLETIETKSMVTFEQKDGLSEVKLDDIAAYNISNVITYATKSTYTNTNVAKNDLYIAKTGLNTSVSQINISYDAVPAYNVGKDGSLLVGHNPGIFRSLFYVSSGDIITLYGKNYRVSLVAVFDLISKTTLKNNNLGLTYTAQDLRTLSSNQIVLMTCTGTYSPEFQTYSQRLLVFANLV